MNLLFMCFMEAKTDKNFEQALSTQICKNVATWSTVQYCRSTLEIEPQGGKSHGPLGNISRNTFIFYRHWGKERKDEFFCLKIAVQIK